MEMMDRIKAALISALAFMAMGCQPLPQVARYGPALDCQAEIDLGQIPSRGAADAAVKISNISASRIEVARLEVSRPCVRVRLAQPIVSPRSFSLLAIHSDEPDFRGRLNVAVRGLGKSDVVLFHTTILVTIG